MSKEGTPHRRKGWRWWGTGRSRASGALVGRRAQPQKLQERESDHHQQGVVVEAGPGATLEMVQPQFPLELLVRLLARPARLDRRDEHPEWRARTMVGQVVLALAGGPPLAYQPSGLTRLVLASLVGWPVGHAHPERREPRGERPLRAASPTDGAPRARRERLEEPFDRFAGWRGHRVRRRAATWLPTWRPHGDVQRIDLLSREDPDGPGESPRAQGLAERGALAVAGVCQHRPERHPAGAHAVELLERDLPLRAKRLS